MSFDRIRPRRPVRPGEHPPAEAPVDVDGKRALYSRGDLPVRGSVSIECSVCRARSVLSPVQALRAALPSLHLPLPGRYRSWMRCPACGRRTWVRLSLQL